MNEHERDEYSHDAVTSTRASPEVPAGRVAWHAAFVLACLLGACSSNGSGTPESPPADDTESVPADSAPDEAAPELTFEATEFRDDMTGEELLGTPDGDGPQVSFTSRDPTPVELAASRGEGVAPSDAAAFGQLFPKVVTAADETSPRGGWRLADAASPYLRQHADNLVEWHPWGDEAFALAQQLDRPVFLSVGYSTCHWCHVMEHESFEDEAIAKLLNEKFISIKVDREERPDVDAHYMRAVQAFSQGRGGWPMSLFLAPDGRAFFGGTYFPPEPRFGKTDFPTLLSRAATFWESDRDKLLSDAESLHRMLVADPLPEGGDWDADNLLKRSTGAFVRRMDPERGGMAGAPKFPPSMALQFLMRRHLRVGADTLSLVETTLDAMAAGGMRDQIGGGFHRYSVDAEWHAPHFEKMLYDNALLAVTYAEAAVVTGNARHARVARDTLAWLRNDMRSPEGLYYSARDADSLPFDADDQPVAGAHPEEGRFYLWTPARLQGALGAEDAEHFLRLYRIDDTGNFEHGLSIADPGRTVEQMAADPGAGLPTGAGFIAWLDDVRARLRVARASRPPAFRDEKALVAWNGLALTGIARSADLLQDDALRAEAGQLARALREHVVPMALGGGADLAQLPHQRFEGVSSGAGDLSDHALLARGLLDAYQATGQVDDLLAARALVDAMLDRFEDSEGAFFTTEGTDPLLPGRAREFHDGAVPSGTSVAVEVLLRLAPLDDEGRLRAAADKALRRLVPLIEQSPPNWPALLAAVDAAHGPLAEVVLDGEGAAHAEMLALARGRLLPAVLLIPNVRDLLPRLDADDPPGLLAWREAPDAEDGRGTGRAWVCVDAVCLAPADDVATLGEQLADVIRR